MSLRSFANDEVTHLQNTLEQYHKVFDHLLGFLAESQWRQAIEDSLKDEELNYSIMEDVFCDYVEEYDIGNINPDEVILQACYNIRKLDTILGDSPELENSPYEIIIKNIQRKVDRLNDEAIEKAEERYDALTLEMDEGGPVID